MSAEVYRKIKALLLIATLVGADVHQASSHLDQHQFHSGLDIQNLQSLVSGSSSGKLQEMMKIMSSSDQTMKTQLLMKPFEAMMNSPQFQEQAKGMVKNLEAMQGHIEAMKADPRVHEHGKRAAEQIEEIATSARFHEHFQRFAEQMVSKTSKPDAMNQAKILQEHMEAMMADPILKEQGQRIAEEMGAMYSGAPELQEAAGGRRLQEAAGGSWQEQAMEAAEGMGANVPSPEQAARVAEQMEAMMNNPKVQGQTTHIGEQMEALMADPAVQEQARLIDERLETLANDRKPDEEDLTSIEQQFKAAMADKSLQEKANNVAEQIKGMAARSKDFVEEARHSVGQSEALEPHPSFQGKVRDIAEQLDVMMANPFSQGQAKLAVERMETIMADPNFEGHAQRFTEQMEAMKTDPRVQEHMKRVSGLMDAAMAQPEFQEQVKNLAERMEASKASKQAELVAEQMEGLMADLNAQELASDLSQLQAAARSVEVPNAMDKIATADKQALADRLVDRMVGDVFDRVLRVDLPHYQALDSTVAAKPSDEADASEQLVLNMRGGGKKAPPLPELKGGSNSIMSSTANTVKAIIGAGILSLSWSFYYSTMLPAIFFSALMALLAAMNFFLLGLVADKTRQSSYTEIWSKLFGKKSGILPDLTIILACFANCAGYLIVAGDYVPLALKGLGVNLPILQSRYNATLLVFALILPLNFLKDLSLLSYTSIIGVLGGIYTCGMLGFDGLKAGFKASDWQMLKFTPGWLLMIPAVAFAFNGHFNAPTAYTEMSEPTPKKWATVTTIAFSICFIATVACGASGYLMFGQDMEKYSNVLTAPSFHSDKAAMIAYIATAISVSLGYPLNSQALRNCMESLLINYTPSALADKVAAMNIDLRRNIIAGVLVFMTLGVALATDSLGLLNSINGAIGGCLMVFLMPSLMYLKSVEGEGGSALSKVLPWASIGAGAFIGVSGTTMAVLVAMGVKVA